MPMYAALGVAYTTDQPAAMQQGSRFDRKDNPYRQGGAVIRLERFMTMLDEDDNRVEIGL